VIPSSKFDIFAQHFVCQMLCVFSGDVIDENDAQLFSVD